MRNKEKDIAVKAKHRIGLTDVLLEGLQLGNKNIGYLENVQYRVMADCINGSVLRAGHDGVIRDGVLRVPAGDMSWTDTHESVMMALYYEGPDYPPDVSLVARVSADNYKKDTNNE